jgi:formyl-CoA transferase
MQAKEGLLPPIRFSDRTSPRPAAPPALGEHTGTILAELGYDRAEIDELRAQGIV